MSTVDRKAAIAEYKKRKALAGIFAVRCLASGKAWVGRAPDVDSIETRLRFGLRAGGHRHPAMQAAWNAHGGGSFAFEIVETVDEELPYLRDAILKGRLAHWREALGADLA